MLVGCRGFHSGPASELLLLSSALSAFGRQDGASSPIHVISGACQPAVDQAEDEGKTSARSKFLQEGKAVYAKAQTRSCAVSEAYGPCSVQGDINLVSTKSVRYDVNSATVGTECECNREGSDLDRFDQ